MEERNFVNNIPKAWWVWPLVPIAAACGASIGATIAASLQYAFPLGGWLQLYAWPLIFWVVFGLLWCVIAAVVAPNMKLVTGVFMGTILCIIRFYHVLSAYLGWDKTGSVGERLVILAGAFLGVLIGVVLIHREAKKDRTLSSVD